MAVILVTATVWSLLLTASLVAPWIGGGPALLLSYTASAAILLVTRGPFSGDLRWACIRLGLGVVAGYVSFPAVLTCVIAAGLQLGLTPIGRTPPSSGDFGLWLAALVFGPIFEELLYRERLLLALRHVLGGAGAIVVTSALFAIPHLESWHLFGTFLVGIALGTVMHAGRSLMLCIGIHAGLNLASLVCGAPPVRLALPASQAALLGLAAGLISLLAARAVGRQASTESSARDWEPSRG